MNYMKCTSIFTLTVN